MANNGEKWRKMAMANSAFSFVKFAISPLAPPPPPPFVLFLATFYVLFAQCPIKFDINIEKLVVKDSKIVGRSLLAHAEYC